MAWGLLGRIRLQTGQRALVIGASGGIGPAVVQLAVSHFGAQVTCLLVNEKPKDLETIKELIETGKLRPFVDKTFPLEQAAEAHRYADSPARKGPVVITVA